MTRGLVGLIVEREDQLCLMLISGTVIMGDNPRTNDPAERRRNRFYSMLSSYHHFHWRLKRRKLKSNLKLNNTSLVFNIQTRKSVTILRSNLTMTNIKIVGLADYSREISYVPIWISNITDLSFVFLLYVFWLHYVYSINMTEYNYKLHK